ncbi:hypothetical protein ACFB49_38490 [Sphingomonas sp. DBB INV C78]|uniref:hypothetical protein n=1 Tax=Sphingomonas sp. DBB INV C78 TaxID=3349434 RepID=UPI0036D3C08E
MRKMSLIALSVLIMVPAQAQETPPPTDVAASAPEPASAPPMKGDARDIATQVCMQEASNRKVELGATAITLREVKDTDKKSDGVAGVTAEVNVVKTDSKGNVKTSKKKFQCSTRNGVLTKFKWS